MNIIHAVTVERVAMAVLAIAVAWMPVMFS
jgi:hypothetical protein